MNVINVHQVLRVKKKRDLEVVEVRVEVCVVLVVVPNLH